MREEIPWKIVGPVLALVLAGVIFLFARTMVTPTVSEKDIKAPAPPGGFPKGGKNAAPSPE